MNRKAMLLLGSVLVATVIAVASAAMSATLCGNHLTQLELRQADMLR